MPFKIQLGRRCHGNVTKIVYFSTFLLPRTRTNNRVVRHTSSSRIACDWSQLHHSNQPSWQVIRSCVVENFVNDLVPLILQTFFFFFFFFNVVEQEEWLADSVILGKCNKIQIQ